MEFERLLELVGDEPVFETALLLAGNVNPDSVRLQLTRWTNSGRVYQLRRSLYAVAPPYQKVKPNPFLIANRMQRASYVSGHSALSFSGLIPDIVPTTFSITTQALDTDASLNALSTRRTIKLAQELDGFSMLDTRADTVNGESATTLNYAYVVVPEAGTAGSARVPVVVEATDTLIKRNGQLVIVHFSSESTAFAGLADLRAKIISSVKLP